MNISIVISPAFASEGCSKPQSTMARSNSGFNRKSLKPDLGRSGYLADLAGSRNSKSHGQFAKPGELGRPDGHTESVFQKVFTLQSAQTFDSQEHHPGKMSGQKPITPVPCAHHQDPAECPLRMHSCLARFLGIAILLEFSHKVSMQRREQADGFAREWRS